MKTAQRILSSTLITLLMVASVACGSSSQPENRIAPRILPLSVSVLPQNAAVQVNTSQQFDAVVSNHSSQAVTWQVDHIPGGNATVGTISSSGLYSAPASVADVTSITVTAVSQQDTSKSGSAGATIVPVITVSVTPVSVQLGAGEQQQFAAVVTGVSNQTVSWSTPLHEDCYYDCSFYTEPADGTIDGSGMYTAPSYPPNDSGGVAITAASQVNPAKSDTGQVTVEFSNASLNGRYSFYVRGRKPGGGEVLAAGVFSADGQGNLTAGVQDVNDSASGVSSNVAFTGTYSVEADGRGTATLTTAGGSSVLRFVLVQGNYSDAGTLGLLMEYDGALAAEGALMHVAGVSVAQGSYAFGAEGFSASGKAAVAGQFTVGANNSIGSGLEDLNLAGVVSSELALTGSITAAVNERGTLNLTSSLGTAHFSFYPLDQTGNPAIPVDRVILMGLDANPALLGLSFPQPGPPSSVTFSGEYVFSRSGTSSGQPFNSAGRFTAYSAGSISNGVTDENLNGTAAENAALTGTFSVAASGRGAATFTSNQVTSHFGFYQSGNDRLTFFVQTDAGSVTAGSYEPQGWSSFDDTALAGRQGLRLSGSAIGGGPFSHLGLLQLSSGNITGVEDMNAVSSQTADASVTGTYAVETNGRATMLLATPSGDLALRLYLLGNWEARVVGVDSTRLVTGTLVRRF